MLWRPSLSKMTDIKSGSVVVVAMDSFKGCLSAEVACRAVARGVVDGGAKALLIPIADGGEGTLRRLCALWPGSRMVAVHTVDALIRPITSRIVMSPDGRAAVDMASTVGLPMLSPSERNPLCTTTFGVGICIKTAISLGARHITVALGGSSTNDGGLGLAQALGARLLDAHGNLIADGAAGRDLERVSSIDVAPMRRLTQHASFAYLFDAAIPFSGPGGAALLYSAQKGADARTQALLDAGMAHLGALYAQISSPAAISPAHGAGAAGGVAGALSALLGAAPRSGIDAILEAAGFDAALRRASLVITGEGQSDAQTLQGKAAAGVLRHARCAGVDVALLAGRINDADALLRAGFCTALDINSLTTSAANPLHPPTAARRLRAAARHLLLQRLSH